MTEDNYHTLEYIGDILVVLLILMGMTWAASRLGHASACYGTQAGYGSSDEEDLDKRD